MTITMDGGIGNDMVPQRKCKFGNNNLNLNIYRIDMYKRQEKSNIQGGGLWTM